MNLSRLKNNESFAVEKISGTELAELRARESEESFDFEELKSKNTYFGQNKNFPL